MRAPRHAAIVVSASLAAACATTATFPRTRAGVEAFVAKVNHELAALWTQAARAEWIMNTYITYDTELLAAKAHEDVLAYTSRAIHAAAAYDGVEVDETTRRQLHLLKVSSALPAPSDAAKRKELATVAAKLTSLFGKGEYCPSDGRDCLDLAELSQVMADSRDYDVLLDAWRGWRTAATPMRDRYRRFVELANEGAKEIGYTNLATMWRSGYDLAPDDFEAETERLWAQVAPLYEALHCYVRRRLAEHYGPRRVPESGLIPAHLLGNMWAQDWMNIYDLVAPFAGPAGTDVTAALRARGYDAIRLVRLAEGFFTSLGMDPLPTTFWERSLFSKPEDRDVVCHPSAWDVDFGGDLRIKMCIKVDEEDLITVHHELGHNYYYMHYDELPVLFQSGAHDGFHEAIGDALALSVTPRYLARVGVLDAPPQDEPAVINRQLKVALDKVAFLPFGKLVDQWRWAVFSGRVPPERYNEAWWQLRRRYQGVDAPVGRTEADFDPGAKYHVPANVPYARYFLARILQFQFHAALCRAAGHEGPLHACSIYGNRAAGRRLVAMLSLGASRPWPDALEVLTGERKMSAEPLLAYFAPLTAWLLRANDGKKCGWREVIASAPRGP